MGGGVSKVYITTCTASRCLVFLKLSMLLGMLFHKVYITTCTASRCLVFLKLGMLFPQIPTLMCEEQNSCLVATAEFPQVLANQ